MKDTFLAFSYNLFLFVIVLSVLDTFFLVSEVPVDYVMPQSANHKHRCFSIVQFAKLNNLDRATVKVRFNDKDKLKLKIVNLETSVYI